MATIYRCDKCLHIYEKPLSSAVLSLSRQPPDSESHSYETHYYELCEKCLDELEGTFLKDVPFDRSQFLR